ncbi:hypothetical protein SAMN02799622_00876 [Methylobacterium sp. UNC378MF]|uniref:hypothetical protein n=1 Tax=Methylobacterium sp. UNC378MF TaxID=1502748 RepID=UPI00087E4047|nr:hypothetical protein [Methylobacterium sp. UNC378MF]SDA12991.1 hypothetical protein SAMN02799622_00876 [Methylobacterium sp. UNC378MF]
MSAPTTKVLMSAGNPTGRKLEELLVEIAEDLRVKNDALEADPSPTSRAIRINNLGILDCLALAGVRQLDTLRRLDLIGPDQGAGGTPRIGAGAADTPAPAAGIVTEATAAPTVTSGSDLVVPAPTVLPAV